MFPEPKQTKPDFSASILALEKKFSDLTIISESLNVILSDVNFSKEGTAISVAVFVVESTLPSVEKWIGCRLLNFILHSKITFFFKF